jgi:hypothetical protein
MKNQSLFAHLVCASLLAAGVEGATSSKPVTDEEAADYAKKMETRFNEGEKDVLVKLLNIEGLVNSALAGLDIDAQERRNFTAGIRDGMVKQWDGSGSLHFLRLTHTNGQPMPLMRVLPETGGVEYQRLALARDPAGRLHIVDVLPLSVGEWVSQSLRQSYLGFAASKDKSLLDRLLGREREYVRHFHALTRLTKDIPQGRHADALETFRKLPKDLQSQRTVLKLVMTAALETNEREYLSLVQLWEQTYPADPTLDFWRLDAFTIRKNYDAALACLDRLQIGIGEDAYLAFLRANLNLLKEDFVAAEKFARTAIQQEGSLYQCYDVLLAISLKKEKFTDTAKLLSELEETSGADLRATIQDSDDYKAFRKSSEYKNWVRAHGKKEKEAQR